jgi:monofunctional biosynthetic peptidoglycan transglycosylase
MDAESKTVVDFSEAEEAGRWIAVNDGVMGGVSQGALVVTEGGIAVFSGTVSLENNGGFASVRTRPREFGLEGFAGLSVRVKGDGKRYKLRARADDNFDGVAYQFAFETTDGKWTTVMAPFAEFKAVYHGRVVASAPPLDPALMKQVGFLVSDGQKGPFRLEFGEIRAWKTPEGETVACCPTRLC